MHGGRLFAAWRMSLEPLPVVSRALIKYALRSGTLCDIVSWNVGAWTCVRQIWLPDGNT
jgi:hypothetical protein